MMSDIKLSSQEKLNIIQEIMEEIRTNIIENVVLALLYDIQIGKMRPWYDDIQIGKVRPWNLNFTLLLGHKISSQIAHAIANME